MPLFINHRFYLELFIDLKLRLQTNELSTKTAPDEPFRVFIQASVINNQLCPLAKHEEHFLTVISTV